MAISLSRPSFTSCRTDFHIKGDAAVAARQSLYGLGAPYFMAKGEIGNRQAVLGQAPFQELPGAGAFP